MNNATVIAVAQNTQDLAELQQAHAVAPAVLLKDIELARVGGGDCLYTW